MEKCIKIAASSDVKTEICECEGDLCNSAQTVVSGHFLTAIVMIASYLFVIKFTNH